MKKIFLLISFFTLLSSNTFARPVVAYFFLKCPGQDRVPLGSASSGDPSSTIFTFNNCLNLCKGCKLEVALGYDDGVSYSDVIKNAGYNSGIYNCLNGNSTSTGILVTDANDKHFISFDLSQITDTRNSDRIYIGDKIIYMTCINLTSINNKDNFNFNLPNYVCLNDCINLGFENYNFDKGELDITWGSQNRTSWKPNPGGSPTKVDISTEDYCFNELGLITVTASIKDACGTKTISKQIEVKECGTNGVPIDCQKCCDWVNIHGIAFQYDRVLGTVVIPNLSNQGCPSGMMDITFSDNSKTRVYGLFAGPFIKTIKKVCYIISNCPTCIPNCITFE